MHGILLRLSDLDPEVEGAVRVIAFYDALLETRAPLTELVRATAALTGCATGLVCGDKEWSAQPRSTVPGSADPSPLLTHRKTRTGSGGTTVWIDRSPADSQVLDDIVLERFLLAASILAEREGSALPNFGDPALVELLLQETCEDSQRARAMRLLSIESGACAQVICVRAHASDALNIIRAAKRGDAVMKYTRVRSDLAVVLVAGHTTAESHGDLVSPAALAEVIAGIGKVGSPWDIPASWQQARTALNFAEAFTLGGSQVQAARYSDLGILALLAEMIPLDAVHSSTDVIALKEMAADAKRKHLVQVAQAFVTHGSLRAAAAALYIHHTTAAAQLNRMARDLGFDVQTHQGKLRLAVALLLLGLNSPIDAMPTALPVRTRASLVAVADST